MTVLIHYLLSFAATTNFYLYLGTFLRERPWMQTAVRRCAVIAVVAWAGLLMDVLLGTLLATVQSTLVIPFTNAAIMMLIRVLVAETAYVGKRLGKLMLIFVYLAFAQVIDVIMYLIALGAMQVDMQFAQGSWFQFAGSFIMQLAIMVLVLTLRRYRRRAGAFWAGDGPSLMQGMIPTTSAAVAMLFNSMQVYEGHVSIAQNAVLYIALAVINVLHFVMMNRFQRLSEENYSNRLAAQELRHREEYYQQVERHQNEVRTIKHDLKNQLIGIGAYLESPEKGKASKQLETIIQDLLSAETASYTRNVAVNALLGVKQRQARDTGIHCTFEVNLPPEMDFLDKDISSLLGNALDNAIEACERCEGERRILLKLLYHGGALIMHLENSTAGGENGLATSKQNKREHGLGTGSIRAVVEKYGGDCSFSIVDGEFWFDATLWGQKK